MASSGASIGALFFDLVAPSFFAVSEGFLPCRGCLRRRCGNPAQEPRHLVERPLRRRQADSLHALRELFEALERQREMSAALGRHERVNLVDDHRVDRAQRFPRVRREQQVDRFGRRDEDVGGIALKAGPLDRGRIPGADGNGRHPVRVAARRRAVGDAGQRRPQVAFDVDGQRLERRQIEHAATRGRIASRRLTLPAPAGPGGPTGPRGLADYRTRGPRGPADPRART